MNPVIDASQTFMGYDEAEEKCTQTFNAHYNQASSKNYILYKKTYSVMQNLQYKRTSMLFKWTLFYSLMEALVEIPEFDTI